MNWYRIGFVAYLVVALSFTGLLGFLLGVALGPIGVVCSAILGWLVGRAIAGPLADLHDLANDERDRRRDRKYHEALYALQEEDR